MRREEFRTENTDSPQKTLPTTAAVTLSIRNFAQIDDVSLKFGDLTVLVGAQGTGKSQAG